MFDPTRVGRAVVPVPAVNADPPVRGVHDVHLWPVSKTVPNKESSRIPDRAETKAVRGPIVF